jgi:hypothetical protein
LIAVFETLLGPVVLWNLGPPLLLTLVVVLRVVVVVRTLVLTCGVRTGLLRTVVVRVVVRTTAWLPPWAAADASVGTPTKSAAALMAAHKADLLDIIRPFHRGRPTQTRPDGVSLHRSAACCR